MRSAKWTGLLGIGLILPGLAIERPSDLDTDLPLRAKPAAGLQAREDKRDENVVPRVQADEHGGQAGSGRAQAPVPQTGRQAYLGLGIGPLPEALRVHLGMEASEGVIVHSVDPNGPAAAVGIEANDVLRSVNGKAVRSQAELRAVTAAHQPGESLDLSLIHKGQERQVKVELGSRVRSEAPAGPAGPFGDGRLDQFFEGLPREQADRIRRAIEENLRLGEDSEANGLFPDFGGIHELQRRMLDGAFQGMANGTMRMAGTSSVRLLDADGSVEIEVRDGLKEVRVRDRDSKILWEGPYNTEEEKAAAPKEVRERIDRVDFNGISGFQFKFGPHQGE